MKRVRPITALTDEIVRIKWHDPKTGEKVHEQVISFVPGPPEQQEEK